MTSKTVYYTDAPEACDICRQKLKDTFFDAPTGMGSWANMCMPCWTKYRRSPKLGVGMGQQYRQQDDQRWLKIAG